MVPLPRKLARPFLRSTSSTTTVRRSVTGSIAYHRRHHAYCGFCVFLVLNLTPCSCKCLVRKVEGRGGGHLALENTAKLISWTCYNVDQEMSISPLNVLDNVDLMYDADIPSSPLSQVSKMIMEGKIIKAYRCSSKRLNSRRNSPSFRTERSWKTKYPTSIRASVLETIACCSRAHHCSQYL